MSNPIEFVSIKLESHPNADQLSVVNVGGWQVVVRTEDFEGEPFGLFITPDSVVDSTKSWFEFLKGHERIKARKFRGVMSQGLLIPYQIVRDNAIIWGTDDELASAIGVKRYIPPVEFESSEGDQEPPPPINPPVYDIEPWQKYHELLQEGETVEITEKIHGCNARFTWQLGRMFVGSRRQWKAHNLTNLWWKALRANPWIEEWCKQNEGKVLYGEVYGRVQDLTYDHTNSDPPSVRVFDVWDGRGYLGVNELLILSRTIWAPLTLVPMIYEGPYNYDLIKTFIDGKSYLAKDQIREGIVIKPWQERWDGKIGRVILKAVSGEYLARK